MPAKLSSLETRNFEPTLPEINKMRQRRDAAKRSGQENFCWKCGESFIDDQWKKHAHDGKFWGERLRPRITDETVQVSAEVLRRVKDRLGV